MTIISKNKKNTHLLKLIWRFLLKHLSKTIKSMAMFLLNLTKNKINGSMSKETICMDNFHVFAILCFQMGGNVKTALSQSQRVKIGVRVSVWTIVANSLLGVGKMVVGFLANNLAVLSDAVHSLSDVATTVGVILGVKISAKAPDKKHNYGHSKVESVFAKMLALVLVVTAVFLGYSAIVELFNFFNKAQFTPTRLAPLLIGVTVVSICTKEVMYWITRSCAIKINSTAMKADAWHHRTDAISSMAVLVGLMGSILFELYWLEAVASLIVALLILKVGIEVYIESEKQMLDTCASEEDIETLHKHINFVEGVLKVDEMKTRLSGATIFVDVEIACDGSLSLWQAHAIAENVEKELLTNTGLNVSAVTVHINPAKIKDSNNI